MPAQPLVSLTGRKLGILVAAAPNESNFAHATALAQRALARGAQVFVYFIHHAIPGIARPEAAALKHAGAKLFVCSLGEGEPVPDIATRAGLGTVSDLIASTDRFVSFT